MESEQSKIADYQPINKHDGDVTYTIHLVILAISVGIFLFVKTSTNFDFLGGIFMGNYILAFFSSLLQLSNGEMKVFWRKQPAEFQAHRLLSWHIWIVSCFSLNRNMPIFQESTDWLTALICFSFITSIAYYFIDRLNHTLRSLLYASLATSALLWLYFALYLTQFYPIGFIGSIFLGLGFHVFIPLILFVGFAKVLYRGFKEYQKPIIAGFSIPILALIIFIFSYNSVVQKIKSLDKEVIVSATDDLPSWVKIAQKTKKNWIGELVLKTDVVYQTTNFARWDFMPERNFEELHKHDPFLLIASIFVKPISIAENDKIKILESRFDARHQTEERFWTGRDLHITDVVTQARVYPEYRMAYTEKTLKIANTEPRSWSQQEAIFTFYLPEGSACTSLSLWINGKEEKAILTTQAKADSAYKTIVGVQFRDPSVVHWQEGNSLKVRVFPCTPKEVRQFKVGITSPLKYADNQLVYENITFKGPESSDADELVKIEFTQAVKNAQLPTNWQIEKDGTIHRNQDYKPNWSMAFDAPKLSNQTFSFGDKSYIIQDYRPEYEQVDWQKVYLDINANWDKDKFTEIYNSLKTKELWIWDEKWIKLNDENKDILFEKLHQNLFSLFPVHRVQDRDHSLLIVMGKDDISSPNLKDLENTSFVNGLKAKTDLKPLRTKYFEGLSPYLKTLQELRLIQTTNEDLDELIKQNKFIKSPESQSVTLIKPAKIIINSTDGKANSEAPDHLLRLFAYNHILQQIGGKYFDKNTITQLLIDEAAQANVVSPISSLIVLETQKDYDDFDIKKSQNSLENATLKSSGSVPEPHEWALIILFLTIVCYYSLKSKF